MKRRLLLLIPLLGVVANVGSLVVVPSRFDAASAASTVQLASGQVPLKQQ
jgi:hypothetical protein